ncbi:MAG: lysoplasmalogenase, partial [Bacteroidota bacterium]
LAIALPYYGWLWPHLGALALPVGVYVGVIVLMAWQAWALQLNAWPGSRIGVAASLFVFSDAVIALNKFQAPFDLAGLLILVTYWSAIALLADSVWGEGERLA